MLTESWRWFGPKDPITLEHIKMTGVTEVIFALYDIPIGDVWQIEDILKYKQLIHESGLKWEVVESIPVHESIKYGGNDRDQYINNYIQSIENISKAGIHILCYNFMPVVDWTRTDLKFLNGNGNVSLRFDYIDFIIFDIFILKRNGTYSEQIIEEARTKYMKLSRDELDVLSNTILRGLPGSMVEKHSLLDFHGKLLKYKDKSKEELQSNLCYFLKKICPIAEKNKIYLAIHPDDPPIDLFDIPRIVSSLADLQFICQAYKSEFNGITLCVGSMASNLENDCEDITKQMIDKINFLHLRNVTKDGRNSFVESGHLNGDVNMIRILDLLISVLGKGKKIHFRPDHGELLFDEVNNDHVNPGYSLYGRFGGLCQLRGVIQTLSYIK